MRREQREGNVVRTLAFMLLMAALVANFCLGAIASTVGAEGLSGRLLDASYWENAAIGLVCLAVGVAAMINVAATLSERERTGWSLFANVMLLASTAWAWKVEPTDRLFTLSVVLVVAGFAAVSYAAIWMKHTLKLLLVPEA